MTAGGYTIDVTPVPGRGLIMRITDKAGAFRLRLSQHEAEVLTEELRLAIEERRPDKPREVEALMAVVRPATGPARVIRFEPEIPESDGLKRPKGAA